jgi:hypothetical protein
MEDRGGKKSRGPRKPSLRIIRGKDRGGKKSRSPRRPSLHTLITQAEKAGKNVASITTTSDGVTLRFGESEPTEPSNPWIADLKKGTKQ